MADAAFVRDAFTEPAGAVRTHPRGRKSLVCAGLMRQAASRRELLESVAEVER
jgi:hypothetical protein